MSATRPKVQARILSMPFTTTRKRGQCEPTRGRLWITTPAKCTGTATEDVPDLTQSRHAPDNDRHLRRMFIDFLHRTHHHNDRRRSTISTTSKSLSCMSEHGF